MGPLYHEGRSHLRQTGGNNRIVLREVKVELVACGGEMERQMTDQQLIFKRNAQHAKAGLSGKT